MVGLRGSRVIVIDDEEKDAVPIMKAFARKGIPVAFFNGQHNGTPTRDLRLVGVRLAILDMDIVGGGTTDKNIISALVNFLMKILSPNNGPYMVIAWTNRPELVDLLDKSLFRTLDIPKPMSIINIEKAECKKKEGFDLKIVSKKMEEALLKFSPLFYLQAWEESCYSAATDVTNELSKLAALEISSAGGSGEPESWRLAWKAKMLQLMYSMAKESHGGHISDGEAALSALYNCMNPLHADRIERHSTDVSGMFKSNADELLTPDSKKECGVNPKARINTMMHSACEQLKDFQAGNVYKAGKKNTLFFDGLVEDIIKGDRTNDAEWKKRKEEFTNFSFRVLMEINPTCDHAQGNVRIGRLIAGYLVPASFKKKMRDSLQFVWNRGYGPLHLEHLEKIRIPKGNYYLYISARHLMTIDLERIKKSKPIIRLRGQAFNDLQAWFGHHAARPGMILLREN